MSYVTKNNEKCKKKKKSKEKRTLWDVLECRVQSSFIHAVWESRCCHETCLVFCTYVYQRVGALLHSISIVAFMHCFAQWLDGNTRMPCLNTSLGLGDSPPDVARSRISDDFLCVNERGFILS